MPDGLTRRDIVLRSIPAIAMAGLFADVAVGQSAPNFSVAFNGKEYVLPPLPYDYNALEPHIDEETMHLHHDKHHQAYVNGLNKALKALTEEDPTKTPALLSGLQEDLSFNAGGHFLHTLFWTIMGPNAGGDPSGPLADAIKNDFGSLEAFRARFAAVAAGVKGSGWAILAYEPVGDRLITLQVKQHDMQLAAWSIPILVLDVWEHAYYLKYHNVRADYVKAWWNVVNWSAVSDALASARKQYGH
jgi:Fe-Mn family superoxide dismutase